MFVKTLRCTKYGTVEANEKWKIDFFQIIGYYKNKISNAKGLNVQHTQIGKTYNLSEKRTSQQS